MPQEPMQVMETFMAAVRSGALADALDLVHPEATFRSAPGLPYSAAYRGPEGLAAMYAAVFGHYDLRIDESRMWPVGDDRVLLQARVRFVSRASGKLLDTTTVEIYTVRNGLVRDVDAYYKDPAAVSAL